MGLWWLSFADPKKEPGSQFLGVIIIRARGMREAMSDCWDQGINPGGEVRGVDLGNPNIHPKYLGRLLTKEQAEEVGRKPETI